MKEWNRWGALGFLLTAFSFVTFSFPPEHPIAIGFMTLPLALTVLFYSGTVMLSVGCVGFLVNRL
jgi:hypothetical protein